MHFAQEHDIVQLQCPEKLVCNKVRLHGKPLAKGTSLFSYGCSVETEVPSHPKGFVETEESGEQQGTFSFHTMQPDLACEKGLAFHTENPAPPTVCLLDLGCTRAMDSRRASTPRKWNVNATKCHACHAEWRSAPGD